MSFYAAACEHSHQINIHDKWKGSFSLVLPLLEKAWVNLHVRNDCQDPFQSHNSATPSTHSPHMNAAKQAPSSIIPLYLFFFTSNLSRHSPPASPYHPPSLPALSSLYKSPSLSSALYLSFPLCIFNHIKDKEAGQTGNFV